MAPNLRKLALAAHLTLSIGWLGTVIAFLALAIAAATGRDPVLVRSACIAMGFTVSYVIVPLAFASCASGLASALGTKWGLYRHYWVVVKLVLTVVAIVVLLKQLGPIEELAKLATDPSSPLPLLWGASKRPLIHAAGGLLVLITVQVLGVYKPWGMTGRGRRQETAAAP